MGWAWGKAKAGETESGQVECVGGEVRLGF